MKTQNRSKRARQRTYFSVLLALFFVWSSSASAQKYVQHSLVQEKLIVQTTEGKYYFQPFTKHILKTTFLPNGTDSIQSSHSVVLQPEIVSFNLDETAKSITLSTTNYAVTVHTKPFRIQYSANNRAVLEQKKCFINDSARGFVFAYPAQEILMGGGERALPMNRRGHQFPLYNKASYGYQMGQNTLNYGIPYVFSSELYSVLFDNPQKGEMDFGKTNAMEWSVDFIGGELTHYFIADKEHSGIVGSYTKLTGRQPLPPRWVLGNLTSRMAYQSEEETRGVVDQMQKENFPIDAIIIDLNWFGKFGTGPTQMGNLDWDKDNWPSPKKMIADFTKKNIKTILITEPYFVDSTTHYDFLKQNKMLATNKMGDPYFLTKFYFGNGGLIDIFKPEAQQWFWKQYKKHIDTGVAGWWGDLGEPEHHPQDVFHVNGKADEVHNIYGHYWEKVLYDGYKADYPDRRIFNLSRSGFAGSQRFSIFPWSGDVSRSWGGLEAQVPIMLSMSMSGLGYMHSDLGGFAMGEKNPELYQRWLQFGVFTPVFRPHGSGHPSEPIYWDTTTKDIVRKAIELRYRMLPYNYSLAWENTRTGTPLARPLWYEQPETKALYEISDSYYWGPSLLVAPVLKGGAKERKLYLPKGIWYDFATGEKHEGGKWLNHKLVPNSIPVFAKGGSFVPMTKNTFSNTEEYSLRELEVHYYAGQEFGETKGFTLYEDDGKLNNAYKREKFATFVLTATEQAKKVDIAIEKNGPEFELMPDQHQIEMVVHGYDKEPAKVLVNGKELKKGKNSARFESMYYGYYYDTKSKELRIRVIYMGVGKYGMEVVW